MPSTSEVANSASDVVVRAEDVALSFRLRFHREAPKLKEFFTGMLSRSAAMNDPSNSLLWALDGVSFDIAKGETVGLVGSNGAGKTTLLRVLAGIYTPDRGTMNVTGRISCVLNFMVGFNFSLSGAENIYIAGAVLGIPKADIDRRLEQIIEFADIGDFIHAPVKTYSSGMRSRLGFSVAINVDPDILLLDEVLAAGDAAFQKKSGNFLKRFQDQGKTCVLASHALTFVKSACSRVIWLDKGKVKADGDPVDVVDQYLDYRQTAS